MSKITIPTHLITEEAMGNGWKDANEAASEFADYLDEHLPGMVADEGDDVECEHRATRDSGMVNNPCAYATVDGEDSEAITFRVQHSREQLWERFCNERGDLAA